jgi:peptidoglycan hydrolase-like protein with peptidoglycan-binding domain
MKRILLASAACLALSLPAMAATAGAQSKPAPQNQQQSMANQPAQNTNAQNTNMQSSQTNQASQTGNKQQAQLIRPSSLSKEQVREIQTKLNKEGFSSGHVDGIWGPDTDQAILNFQKAKKLPGHGELTQQTVADLGVKLNNQSETTASSNASGTNSGSAMNNSTPNSNAKGQTATTSNHAGSMNNKAGSNPSNTKP